MTELPPVGTGALVCFLDETGVVAQDTIFGVGVLSVPEDSDLPTAVRKYRQRTSWHSEWHFCALNQKSLNLYKGLIDVLTNHPNWSFTLTLADRDKFDVVQATGDRFLAYERIAAQSLAASMPADRQAVALADEYTTPDTVRFEEDVRHTVNTQQGGNRLAAVVRVTSNCHDLMQAADVLTGALTFPLRGVPRTGKRPSPKRRLANYVAAELGSRLPVQEFETTWLSHSARR